MIGIDALVNQRLMMDFEKHVIKVEDAQAAREMLHRRDRDRRRGAGAAS